MIRFPDGTEIKGDTQFDSYLQALDAIGIDKAAEVIKNRGYSRQKAPLISKKQEDSIIKSKTFSYVKHGDYYVIKGFDTMEGTLKGISDELNLGLDIRFE